MANKTVTEEDLDDKKMPLLDHLIELRQRLIHSIIAFVSAFILGFYFAKPIFNFLAQPLIATSRSDHLRTMIYTAPLEGFMTLVKVGMFAGAFLAFPLVAIQIWRFVAPGLYRHEKQAFLPFLIATPVMFVLGAAVVFYAVLPVGLQFLASFEQLVSSGGEVGIEFTPKMNEYLSFVMSMILAFGISFELPVLLLILVRIGVLQAATLAGKRRYAVVGVVAFAGIVTPPDVLSQIGLAVPLYLLYEASIWIGYMIEKRRDAAQEDDEEEAHAQAPSSTPAAPLPAIAAPVPADVAPLRPPAIDETDFNTR